MIVVGDEVCRWTAERTGGKFYPGSGKAIGLERNGNLVAGVLFDNFNGRSIQMHVASDGSRAWMTRAYLRACFTFPFDQLKVEKIVGLVDSTNTDARRFDEHLGFTLEATIAGAGKHGDVLIYTMTRRQCRWIKD